MADLYNAFIIMPQIKPKLRKRREVKSMEINKNEVYTLQETQAILKVSLSTLMRMIKKGLIRTAKVGKQYRIWGKELLRILSPQLEDRVGKVYNKARRWAHEDLDPGAAPEPAPAGQEK